VAKTIQTTANSIAAVNVNAAKTGDMGTLITFDIPEAYYVMGKRKERKNLVI
jgi:hypothetical protein